MCPPIPLPLFLLLLIVASPPTPSPSILVICPPHTSFSTLPVLLIVGSPTPYVFHHLFDCRPTLQFPSMFSWDNKCFVSLHESNVLLHYAWFKISGDLDSQWKVFEEMKKNNVAPNQFSYSNIVRSYLLKYVHYYLTLLLPHNSMNSIAMNL